MCREGAIDLSPGFSVGAMYNLEQQQHPLKILSGVHVGCYALVGSERVRSVRELKGKTVSPPSGPFAPAGGAVLTTGLKT